MKRRWKYSLRAALIVMLVTAIAMAVAKRMNRLQTAIELIESRGGVIHYESDVERQGLFGFSARSDHNFFALCAGTERISSIAFEEKYLEYDFSEYDEDELWDALESLDHLCHLKVGSRGADAIRQPGAIEPRNTTL